MRPVPIVLALAVLPVRLAAPEPTAERERLLAPLVRLGPIIHLTVIQVVQLVRLDITVPAVAILHPAELIRVRQPVLMLWLIVI